MTQAEVEAAYQEIINQPAPSYWDYVELYIPFIGILIGFTLLCALALVGVRWLKRSKPHAYTLSQIMKGLHAIVRVSVLLVPSAMIMTLATSLIMYYTGILLGGDQAQKDIKAWKTDVVQPYLASLPKQEQVVHELEFYDESEFQSKQSSSWFSRSQDATVDPYPKMSFSYTAEGQRHQHTVPQRVQKDLPKGAAPRVQFVQLTKPLGVMSEEQADRLRTYLPNLYPIHPEYAVGDYEFVVHVPADYAINGTLRW